MWESYTTAANKVYDNKDEVRERLEHVCDEDDAASNPLEGTHK